MSKRKTNHLDFEVDKLTRSIENIITGDSFPTNVSLLTKEEVKNITKKNGWQFDWKSELKFPEREVYKLTITSSPNIIQGLVGIEVLEDHVYMHLIESAPFNLGKNKVYTGVAGNLVAFACKHSMDCGHEGNVGFYAKTRLVQHYIDSIGATSVAGQRMGSSLKVGE